MKDFNCFEKEIQRTYYLPDANPAFINRLEKEIENYRSTEETKTRYSFHIAKCWGYAMVTLLVLVALLLAIGPSRVLAQIQAVLGFVPEVGIVDSSTSFYQLIEPVSDSRDGVTLTVQSAFLSADQTIISFSMTDLSEEIKRAKFGDAECSTPAYLIFPDGSKVQSSEQKSSLLPTGTYEHTIYFNNLAGANFNQATLVFPCLTGTGPGKGPQDWQFDLAFKPAPEDVTVYPITLTEQTELKETEAVTTEVFTQSNVDDTAAAMPEMIVDGDRQEKMTVLSVVEKPDSYWVAWAYPNAFDTDIQINGHLYLRPFNPVLYDTNGVELPLPDKDMQIKLWEFEDSLRRQLSNEDQMKYIGSIHTFVVPKSGVFFPVYAKANVFKRSFPEKEHYAEIEFDGSLVQNSDEPIEINQEIQIGSTKFELESIEKSAYGGYTFHFNGSESRVVQCQVELLGYQTNISGSGNFVPEDLFGFSQSVVLSSVPTGRLIVRVSQPAVLEDLISFIGSWSPDN